MSLSSNDELWIPKVSVSEHLRLLAGPASLQPAAAPGAILVIRVLRALTNWPAEVRGDVHLAAVLARHFPHGKSHRETSLCLAASPSSLKPNGFVALSFVPEQASFNNNCFLNKPFQEKPNWTCCLSLASLSVTASISEHQPSAASPATWPEARQLLSHRDGPFAPRLL